MNDLTQHEESKTSSVSCDICVCRNNKTGKYFIVIDSNQDTLITLVTPVNTILPLQSNLFSDPEDMDENILRKTGLLSEGQLATYYRYIEENDKEFAEGATQTGFKHGGAEPEYIRTYRNMLNNTHSMPSTMHRIVEERGSIKWHELKEQLTKHGYLGTGGSLTASLRVLELDGYVQIEGVGDNKSIIHSRVIERTVIDKKPHKTTNKYQKLFESLSEEQKEKIIRELSELL